MTQEIKLPPIPAVNVEGNSELTRMLAAMKENIEAMRGIIAGNQFRFATEMDIVKKLLGARVDENGKIIPDYHGKDFVALDKTLIIGNVRNYLEEHGNDLVQNAVDGDALDISNAKANGITLIEGGYIKTDFLTADNMKTGTLDGEIVNVKNLNANSITGDVNRFYVISVPGPVTLPGSAGGYDTTAFVPVYEGTIPAPSHQEGHRPIVSVSLTLSRAGGGTGGAILFINNVGVSQCDSALMDVAGIPLSGAGDITTAETNIKVYAYSTCAKDIEASWINGFMAGVR